MKVDETYVQHILEAIHRILTYTENMDQKTFLEKTMVQDAVIRNLEIIGEATKKVTMEFRLRHEGIPWKQMAGMRDKLIHDYIGVDLWAVWKVVEADLPLLQVDLAKLIEPKAQ